MPSAQDGATRAQLLFTFAAAMLFLVGVMAGADPLATLAASAAPVFLIAIIVQLGASLEPQPPGVDPAHLAHRIDWPSYTILIPLYREARMVDDLVERMAGARLSREPTGDLLPA
jgi:hypothetical protein